MTEASATRPHVRAIRLWLLAVAALLVAMVLVGGATRLTESGVTPDRRRATLPCPRRALGLAKVVPAFVVVALAPPAFRSTQLPGGNI